jgi:hypothetical protein
MWEIIDKNSFRLKVPGGWIVKSVHKEFYSGISVSVHQIFIKDEGHNWKLNE